MLVYQRVNIPYMEPFVEEKLDTSPDLLQMDFGLSRRSSRLKTSPPFVSVVAVAKRKPIEKHNSSRIII